LSFHYAAALQTFLGIWLAMVRKIYAPETNGMKILSKSSGLIFLQNLNEPEKVIVPEGGHS